jgi:dCTP diphosphatase
VSDPTTTLSDLRDRAVAFRDERDWRQFHTPKDLAIAVGVEAAELAECFLWRSPAEIDDALRDTTYRSRVADEIADVLIFLLYLADATGIDVADAVDAKIGANAAKYPVERARGSAAKYTELG